MAIYIGNNKVIDDYNELLVGQYSSRANLPGSGVVGYLAYVTDQNELVINTGQTVHPSTTNSPAAPTTTSNSPDSGVTWYKVLTNPANNQLSAVLNQGTLAGGYTNTAIWNEITKITFATDASALMQQTLPWATRYSTAHSTSQYAYYHTGYVSNGTYPGATAKQSWTTNAVATISSTRPTVNGNQAVTFQSGSAIDVNTQNIGVIQYGGATDFINFTTDTWSTDSKYTPPVNETYGFAASGPVFSYTTRSNVQKYNWSSNAWTSTGRASPTSSAYRGGMSTGWNKCYNAAYQYLDKFDQSTDQWTALPTSAGATLDGPMSLVEISSLTGQNWGYWFGIPYLTTQAGGYGSASRKTLYATDTTYNNPQTGVGVGGWGSASAPGGVIGGITYSAAVDGSPPSGNSACTANGP